MNYYERRYNESLQAFDAALNAYVNGNSAKEAFDKARLEYNDVCVECLDALMRENADVLKRLKER